MTASPSGTIVTYSASTIITTTSGGSVKDATGNVFTLNSAGDLLENGVAIPDGAETSELTVVNGVIWAQDGNNGTWYTYVGGFFVSQGTATPPTSSGSAGTITDSAGEVWTILANKQAAVNGIADTTTANVSELAYVNGLVYYENTSGGWWSKSVAANPWIASSSPFTSPAPSPTTPTATLRKWYENPGIDGSYWVQPFQTTAQWDTSSSSVTALRNGSNGSPTGNINVKGNYAAPWVIGTASDPIVKVTNGTKSINVHIPLGTIIETPTSQWDQSIGGADSTQPYLVWSISGATLNTGSVQASGSIITGSYGFQIDDGAGWIMCDAITNQPGNNNSIGGIQDLELTYARNDPNYVIQHMLAVALDPSQVSRVGPVWPLLVIDTSIPNTGILPQGQTYGIPMTTSRPTGQTRGFNLLFDQLQQFGWIFYNVGGAGCATISVYSNLTSNAALVSDIQNSIDSVMQYVCILTNQTGMSSLKGFATGGHNAFPAPPLLDLSPTGGVNILPSSFGAWYPSGWNTMPATPVYPPAVPTPAPVSPNPPAPTPTAPTTPTPTSPTPTPTTPTQTATQAAFWSAMTTELNTSETMIMGVAINSADPQAASGHADVGTLNTPSATVINTFFNNF